MSYTIKPNGAKLIVTDLPSEETETAGGIVVMDFQLKKGKILEVSKEWEGKYNVGETVIYPEGAGLALPHYKKQNCTWIDGRSPDEGGDVWGIVIDDKAK